MTGGEGGTDPAASSRSSTYHGSPEPRRRLLVIDPQGYDYARYVALA